MARRVAAADPSRSLLATEATQLPADGDSSGRSLVTIVRDATPGLAEADTAEAALLMAGAAGVLLHVSQGDDPRSAHCRLRTLAATLGAGVKVRTRWSATSPLMGAGGQPACAGVQQVPLLLLSSSADLSREDLGAWLTGLLAGDAALSGHVAAHCIHVLPRMPSTQQLLSGLQWLAQHAPAQPQLKVPFRGP